VGVRGRIAPPLQLGVDAHGFEPSFAPPRAPRAPDPVTCGTPATVAVSRGSGGSMRWACLLAGLAVEVVHRVDRNCVATDGVDVVHGNLPQKSQLVVQGFRPGESPLYNGNSVGVIPLHVVSRRVAAINLDTPDFTRLEERRYRYQCRDMSTMSSSDTHTC